MAVRLFGIVGFVLVSLGCASQVSADFFFGIFSSAARDIKRRQCWPQPFDGADRAATRAPFVTMVSNGWRRQNMLGDAHFDASTGQLTDAGRLKLRWILVNAPQQHRMVFVRTGLTEEETSNRMAVVQQAASQIAPNNLPPVLSTSILDDGWPAVEVDAISRKYIGSTPVPRLTAPSASGGGSSGSGGGQ
jgi:hypothetical protein